MNLRSSIAPSTQTEGLSFIYSMLKATLLSQQVKSTRILFASEHLLLGAQWIRVLHRVGVPDLRSLGCLQPRVQSIRERTPKATSCFFWPGASDHRRGKFPSTVLVVVLWFSVTTSPGTLNTLLFRGTPEQTKPMHFMQSKEDL